jgi:Family of unknown function (DUF6282)
LNAESRATQLLDGAVDLHVHPAPSPFPRRFGPAGAARHAADSGMRAMALKSHHHNTAMDVAAVRADEEMPAGVELFGGIVLNSQVGGFNPDAVNLSLAMGGKIVWMPTISSPAHIEHAAHGAIKFPSSAVPLTPEPPIDIWTAEGKIARAVREVLAMVAEADAVLASGHLPAASVVAAFELAHELGVRRLLVNHPNFIIEASPAQVGRMVALGAYVEHATCMYDDESKFRSFELPELVEWIKAVGPERTTLASDLGQTDNPLPAESLVRIVEALHAEGFTDAELRRMTSENPARLIGLEAL